jgi:SNF2 family DNA or RNA helicase
MDTIKEISYLLKFANKVTLDKGKKTFDHHDLKIIHDDDLEYLVTVPDISGDKKYVVSVNILEEEELIDDYCSCAYYEKNIFCPHSVAALLALQDYLKKEKIQELKKTLPLLNVKRLQTGNTSIGYFLISGIVISNQLIESLSHENIYTLERKIWNNFRWNPVVSHENKKVSFQYETRISSTITYIDSHTLKATCSCNIINTNHLCQHALILLLLIKHKISASHFRLYDDLSTDKNKLLAQYGLTLEDKFATSFSFNLDQQGNVKISHIPDNLFAPNQTNKWQNLKDKLAVISPSSTPTEATSFEPFEKVAIQMDINPSFEPHLVFSVLGIRKKKTGEGLLYKKLSIRNTNSLPLMASFYPEVGPILQTISLDLWDQMIQHKNGNWDYLPSKQKANWINKVKFAFNQLAICKQAPDILVQEANMTYKKMALHAIEPVITFKLSIEKKFILLQGFITLANQQKIPIYETQYSPWFLLLHHTDVYLVDDNMVEVLTLFTKSDLYIPLIEFNKLHNEVITPLSKRYEIIYDESFVIEETSEEEIPTMQIKLSELGNDYLILSPCWKYGDIRIDIFQGKVLQQQERFLTIRRNEAVESEYIQWLKNQHPSFINHHQAYFYLPIKDAFKDQWYFNFLANAREKEVELVGTEKLKHFNYNTSTPTLTIKAGKGIDWFDVEIEVDYGGLIVPLSELKKAILAQQPFIKLSDGSLGVIPHEWNDKYGYLLKSAKLKDNTLQVSKFHWTLVDALYDQRSEDDLAQELKRKKELLSNLDTKNIYTIPKKIKATLRDYQKAGFQWLCTLDSLEWGGCLADDMGLGKTLQTLTFLTHVNTSKKHTHLIVCPTSLIYNWESEILKFCKHLKYHIHYGSERADSSTHFADFDIVITSYGILRSDIKKMIQFSFHYIILDESHAIKNPVSQVAKAVSVLQCKNRIALSGTPLQNNTMDIYAQMNFLNPGMLGSVESFKAEFATPIDKHNDKGKIEMLRTLLYPFMLRRTKEQVAKDLPDKTESILWCEMEAEQGKIYNSFKEYYRKLILNKIDEEGMNKSSFFILEGLLKLRQICDSPAILNEAEKYPNVSIKIAELVRELTENNSTHKALVFSQFVTMLKLIENELIKNEIEYIYLDGQTKAADRKKIVETFQTDVDKKVMLISLKAGGVGLNLTAADYVYLIDPWWNPAIEQQAIDRTHRIGQTQKVFAYKMICKDSIEEKILMLQDKKKSLSADIISGETSFVKKLTRDDIQFLFT